WVAPGRPLITLVDDQPLRIELSVPEAAVRAVKLDQRVELVAVAHPDKKYGAKVTRVGAEIGRTRSLIVEATLDPGNDLVPGMFAEAHVTIGQTTRPVVPAEAVVKRGKLWHAFVVVKGEVQDRIVHLGPDPGPGQRSILQGLVKGDKVVAKATDQVVDGIRVVE
ncbi:MAG: HlyD family efflux transporter periplasmic adaptor subunit, partial [Kofleriaceae bacterium]